MAMICRAHRVGVRGGKLAPETPQQMADRFRLTAVLEQVAAELGERYPNITTAETFEEANAWRVERTNELRRQANV